MAFKKLELAVMVENYRNYFEPTRGTIVFDYYFFS